MVDLQPGVPSLTRVSYAWELRGQLRPARIALERALDMASRPSDIAFCRFYLGELAWNSGRVSAADEHYAAGLQQDPSYLPLLSGRAKVAAARGDVALAIARYDELVQRMPTPSHLIAYADLLRSVGRAKQADQQDAVVGATQTLLEAEGVNVDPEIAVFDADRGRARAALKRLVECGASSGASRRRTPTPGHCMPTAGTTPRWHSHFAPRGSARRAHCFPTIAA
jgi:tetratricopeptide (TPR) repeat protein